MGLPDHISTGVKYNFEEDLESGSGVRTPQKSNKGPLPPSTASFIRSTSCFFVTHVPSTLPWYTEVLGFQVRGKAEASRAELFRGAPGVNRGNDGVFLYLRKISDEGQPVPKGSLWIEVDNIDGECAERRGGGNHAESHTAPSLTALYAETSAKLQRYAQDVSDYFPPLYFGSTAKIVAKPRNTAWGQREMTTMDDVGNSIIFYQLLE